MKNSKIIILTTLLAAALLSCSDWTEMEPVEQRISTPPQQDPAAYAAYAAKVRAYKQSDHKRFFVAFDNTDAPSSPGQTVVMLPDSTDMIALRNPQRLSDMDRRGIRTAQQDFGTRVLCYVEGDAAAALALAEREGLDGFVVGAGATPELIAALSAAAGPGKRRMLVLEGAALHLSGDQHTVFDYNVLSTASASTTFEVGQQVEFARSVYGFADEQILLGTRMEGTITDAELRKRDMLPTMLALVADLGPLGGLSIAGIESDYYHAGGNFLTARNAIKELNQLN